MSAHSLNWLEAWIGALPAKERTDTVTVLRPQNPLPPHPNPERLRVMSWNIAWARGSEPGEEHHRIQTIPQAEQSLREMAAVLRDEAPDIVLLQETDFAAKRSGYFHQPNFLGRCAGLSYAAQALTWHVPHLPFPYWPPSKHHGYVRAGGAVLSRWPLQNNTVRLYPKPLNNPWWYNAFYPLRYTQHVQVQWAGRWWSILNNHLEAFDRPNRVTQAAHLLALARHLGPDLLVCGGDFNTTPPEASQKHNFPDEPRDDYRDDNTLPLLRDLAGFRELLSAPSDPPDPPDWWTFPSAHPNRRLDYLFYPPNTLTLTDRRVLDARGLSDHKPIIAEFALVDPQGRSATADQRLDKDGER